MLLAVSEGHRSSTGITIPSSKVSVRLARLRDLISVERLMIGAKQPRISAKMAKMKSKNSILLGIALLRRLTHIMGYLGARTMGQQYLDYTVVTEVNGRICGACMVNTAMGRDPSVWFLGPIAVDAAHRGMGLGSILVKESLKYIRSSGGRRVVLTVASENVPAMNLYRRWGFREDESDRTMVCDL